MSSSSTSSARSSAVRQHCGSPPAVLAPVGQARQPPNTVALARARRSPRRGPKQAALGCSGSRYVGATDRALRERVSRAQEKPTRTSPASVTMSARRPCRWGSASARPASPHGQWRRSSTSSPAWAKSLARRLAVRTPGFRVHNRGHRVSLTRRDLARAASSSRRS